jgi:hypothetical protein
MLLACNNAVAGQARHICLARKAGAFLKSSEFSGAVVTVLGLCKPCFPSLRCRSHHLVFSISRSYNPSDPMSRQHNRDQGKLIPKSLSRSQAGRDSACSRCNCTTEKARIRLCILHNMTAAISTKTGLQAPPLILECQPTEVLGIVAAPKAGCLWLTTNLRWPVLRASVNEAIHVC